MLAFLNFDELYGVITPNYDTNASKRVVNNTRRSHRTDEVNFILSTRDLNTDQRESKSKC